jgi:hypothetical protein
MSATGKFRKISSVFICPAATTVRAAYPAPESEEEQETEPEEETVSGN